MLDLPTELIVAPSASEVAPARDSVVDIEVLIAEGKFDIARQQLTALEATRKADNQVQFLLALLDINDRKFRDAVQRLRQILIREPGTARVRLELGRALFLDGNYVAAERQFRLARAGQLPPTVQVNVDRYLGAIRQRKRFSVDLAFAIAPDSNVNAGPASDTVTIYGLPFQLSEDARANSGVGATADAAIEWAPPVTGRTGLRFGVQGHHAQYRTQQFNDSTVAAYAGTRILRPRWTFDLTGTLAQRWFGGKRFSRSAGGALSASFTANRQTELSATVGAYSVVYPTFIEQDGVQTVVTLAAARALSPRSIVRTTIGLNWQSARVAPLANHRQTFGVEWFRDFPGGLSLQLSPSVTRIGYDAPLAAFGTTRVDWQITTQTRLQSRRIDLYGFTPRVGYIFTRNSSTIPLYRFTRNRFEFGIVRSF